MTVRNLILALVCSNVCAMAQPSGCNQSVRYSELKSKLDSSICIPKLYQIIRVKNDVDLNNDNLIDNVVKYQKINLSDGDTVFYTIYLRQANGSLRFHTILPNLEPYYFKSYESKSGNELYDSIKSLYTYPTAATVEFGHNSINLTFYLNAATLTKIFFEYSTEEKTWISSREIQWFAPTIFEDDRKLEFDRRPGVPLRIEQFNLLKYIDK